MTIGKLYDPAMVITDQAEADAYLEKLIQYSLNNGVENREKAIEIVKSNLGYYSGYYSHDTARRVQTLFRCEHPILGSILEKEYTPEEAFQKGMEWGKKHLQKKLKVGDTLPMHKYSDLSIPLEKLTLMFYKAYCREDEDDMEHISMAIEEIIGN